MLSFMKVLMKLDRRDDKFLESFGKTYHAEVISFMKVSMKLIMADDKFH